MQAGICTIGIFVVLEETHESTLKRRARERNEGKPRFPRGLLPRKAQSDISVGRSLSRSLLIPVRLAGHLHIFLVLVFMLVFNGIVNVVLSSLGSVYQANYGFPPSTAGLAYLGIGFGGIAALGTANRISAFMGRQKPETEGAQNPKHNLPLILMANPTTTIGLLWYGWTCKAHVFWFVPIIGLWFFGYAYMSIRVCKLFHQ
jgi:hypothetical protein